MEGQHPNGDTRVNSAKSGARVYTSLEAPPGHMEPKQHVDPHEKNG